MFPTDSVVEIRSGKKRTIEKNFCSGYMFVYARYDEEVNNLIQSAPSSIGFLKGGRSDTVPTPITKREADRILGRVHDNQELAEKGGVVDIPYKERDHVKVTSGPFNEFNETVEEVLPEKLKLLVLGSYF